MVIEDYLSFLSEYKFYILCGVAAVFILSAIKGRKGSAVFFGILTTLFINFVFSEKISANIALLSLFIRSKLSSAPDNVISIVVFVIPIVIRTFPYWIVFLVARIIRKLSCKLKKIHQSNKLRQQELKQLQELEKQKEQLEAAQKHKQLLFNQIADTAVYNINILPLLELLSQEGQSSKSFDQAVKKIKSHSVALQQKCKELNSKAEKLGLSERVTFHSK